jgi:hypothetical protein
MKKTTVFALGLILVLGALASACAAKLNEKFEPALNSALDASKGQFKACYEDALKRDREAQGEMDLAIAFQAEGKAPSDVAVAKSAINDDKMKVCVADAAKAISLTEMPNIPVERKQTLSFEFEKK